MSIKDGTYIVLDTETTGADPTVDCPIEIAVCRIVNWQIEPPKSWLIHPGYPIPPEASAIHHLTDEDVCDAPSIDAVMPEVLEYIGNSPIIAHNAPFDRSMMPPLKDHTWICTLRMAKHIWPKGQRNSINQPLANHQQQTIRYWLKLKIDTMGLAAHRAAADILVTAELFKRLTDAYLSQGGDDDIDYLLEIISSPIILDRMPFGLHTGKQLSAVPTEYMEYLIKKDSDKPLDSDLKASLSYELERRKAEQILINRVQENVS